jgi:hypothetical protein
MEPTLIVWEIPRFICRLFNYFISINQWLKSYPLQRINLEPGLLDQDILFSFPIGQKMIVDTPRQFAIIVAM